MTTTCKPHPRDAERVPITGDSKIWNFIAEHGYTIGQMRKATMCANCGHVPWDPDTGTYDNELVSQCSHGCCMVFRCVQCAHPRAGYGINDCDCDHRRNPRIIKHVITARLLLVSAVGLARAHHYSWDEIGDVLGISRFTAQRRFGPKRDVPS